MSKLISDHHAQEEQEANQFAMALLMPEKLLRKEVAKLQPFDLCDDRKILLLAKKFQVSVTMMALRLGQLYPKL